MKKSDKKDDDLKIQSPFIRYCITAVSCILICGAGFLFLMFNTNTIFSVNEDSIVKQHSPVRRVNVSTVISTIEENVANNDNSDEVTNNDEPPVNPNTPGVVPELSGGWYSSVPDNLKTAGTPVIDLELSDGVVRLYNGLPWDAEESTYIFDIKTAAEDTINYINTMCGQDSGLSATRFAYSYELKSKNSIRTENGVVCLSFAPMPALVTPTYNNEFKTDLWWQESTPSGAFYGYAESRWDDESLYPGARKYCAILRSKTDGSIYYLPLCAMDSKAHTFPGGVMQTNIRLRDGSANSNQGPFTIDIGDTGTQGKEVSWNNFIEVINTEHGESGGPLLKEYMKACLEFYGCDATDCQIFLNYECLGFVAW